jgi:hypothetical protein
MGKALLETAPTRITFDMLKQYPSYNAHWVRIADNNACEGLDGRQIRKLVAAACGHRAEVAMNPALLTGADVLGGEGWRYEQRR